MANVLGQSITSVAVSSAADTDVILVDRKLPGGVDIGWVVVNSDTPIYNCEVFHTFDETPDAASGSWHSHSQFAGTALAAATNLIIDGNYGFGITGIKATIDTYTSGTLTLTVVQAGKHN